MVVSVSSHAGYFKPTFSPLFWVSPRFRSSSTAWSLHPRLCSSTAKDWNGRRLLKHENGLSHGELIFRFMETRRHGSNFSAGQYADTVRYNGKFWKPTGSAAHFGPRVVRHSNKSVWKQEIIEVKNSKKGLRQGVVELETSTSKKVAQNFSQDSVYRRANGKSGFNGMSCASRAQSVRATTFNVEASLNVVEEPISDELHPPNVSVKGCYEEGKDATGNTLFSNGLSLGKELDDGLLSHEMNGVNGKLCVTDSNQFLGEAHMDCEQRLRMKLCSIFDKVLVVDNVTVARKVVHMLTNQYKHLVHACDTEVSKIDVKLETPVNHGEIICFSIYSGEEVDYGNGKSCIWVDVLDGGDKDILAEFASFFEDASIKKPLVAPYAAFIITRGWVFSTCLRHVCFLLAIKFKSLYVNSFRLPAGSQSSIP